MKWNLMFMKIRFTSIQTSCFCLTKLGVTEYTNTIFLSIRIHVVNYQNLMFMSSVQTWCQYKFPNSMILPGACLQAGPQGPLKKPNWQPFVSASTALQALGFYTILLLKSSNAIQIISFFRVKKYWIVCLSKYKWLRNKKMI